MPPKKMEAKVAVLENEVTSIKDALQALNLEVDVNQDKLIALLTKRIEDVGGDTFGVKTMSEIVTKNSEIARLKKHQGESLDEFYQLVKKVELSLFNGDDPAGWITRVELKVELIGRYGGIKEGDMFKQLASLQQLGSVEEYIQEFERLTSQWSTSYKNDEEVHCGAMGPETILDWVPLIGSIHITCLAQMQWAEPVTSLKPSMFRSPSQAFGNCEDAKDEGEVKMLIESEGKEAKADDDDVDHGVGMEDTRPMTIKLGDGYRAMVQGQCRGLEVVMGDVSVKVDALLFKLEGIDMVLGMAWLASLGGMWVNWKEQVIKLQLAKKCVELRRELSWNITQDALQSFFSEPKRAGEMQAPKSEKGC
ncbi:hypothetical protein D0Y65_030183 [Glycine soja]|uniref:Retrotransposon gag domain-containing protein n=1 Tax=Glycine soja TaxID=3848 RepID=A0A445I2M2_GLYSO|nr:hypothetical protein D0Y65_030183 [Glycine soja]